MTPLPPRLAIERASDDRLVVRWENPPSSTAVLSPGEVREIALALLDVAAACDEPVPDDENRH